MPRRTRARWEHVIPHFQRVRHWLCIFRLIGAELRRHHHAADALGTQGVDRIARVKAESTPPLCR